MTTRRKPPVNAKLAALMESAVARSELNIVELGKATGLGRGVVGRIYRGEIQRPAPEQANRLVPHLPITMMDLLEACGYDVSLSPQHRVPNALAEVWAKLPPKVRDSLLELARAAATNGDQGEGSGQ